MLYFNAMRVLKLRGVERAYSYLRAKGFVHSATGNIIGGRVVQIKIKRIERLCLALNCTPNDLFEWRDDEAKPIAETHALQALKRDGAVTHINRMLKNVPVEKLDEISRIIEEMQKKQI